MNEGTPFEVTMDLSSDHNGFTAQSTFLVRVLRVEQGRRIETVPERSLLSSIMTTCPLAKNRHPAGRLEPNFQFTRESRGFSELKKDSRVGRGTLEARFDQI